MKKKHDEIAAKKRRENYSKFYFLKALQLLKKAKINFKNVIDIGCGKGEFLKLLKENFSKIDKLYGIDYIDDNLRALKNKGFNPIKIDLDSFKIENFEFLKGKFDLAVCLETIEHIFNLDRLFMFFNYLLKENGCLLISTPNMGCFQAKFFYLLRGYPYGENHHVRFLTIKKLHQYAFFNRFVIVSSNNYFSFQIDIIKRGLGIRNKFLSRFLAVLLFGPLFILSKMKITDSISNFGLIELFKKDGTLPPLGLELENFKINFENLDSNTQSIWKLKIKEFMKKDKMKEHLYFRDYILNILYERGHKLDFQLKRRNFRLSKSIKK